MLEASIGPLLSFQINNCHNRNIRNIKYKDYYQNNTDEYDPNEFKNPFKAPSSWEPKISQLSSETADTIQRINSYINYISSTSRVSSDTQTPTIHCHNTTDNLTRSERQSLRNLGSNKHIIIKPADKDGAVVIMDTENYEQEGFRQLLNKISVSYTHLTLPTKRIV